MKNRKRLWLCLAVLLIITIVYCIGKELSGQVNRFFWHISPITVSSISIEKLYPRLEMVLSKEDQNQLIKLLKQADYNKNEMEDIEKYTILGGPIKPVYTIHFHTTNDADIMMGFGSFYCVCCPETLAGPYSGRLEWRYFAATEEGLTVHERICDYLAELLKEYSDEN